jgi:hypothetical protein
MTAVRVLLAALALSMGSAGAAAFQISEPTADRWMYPFINTTPGLRTGAPVFGAVGDARFDDRDGQFLVRFDTTGIVAAGLGTANYTVSALRLTLTVAESNSFRYDPTADALATYDGTGVDADDGRPVELFGVGYRGGFTRATFRPEPSISPAVESTPFTLGSPLTEGSRIAFAAGDVGGGISGDVSNNVRDAFEPTAFSIGQIAGLVAGSLVPLEREMTFDLNLVDPFVLAYVREGLDAGVIEFMVTSLNQAVQEVGGSNPSFYTKENANHDPAFGDFLAGRLSGDLAAVPEPSAVVLVGIAGLFAIWRWRRARV